MEASRLPEVVRIHNNYDEMSMAEERLDAIGRRYQVPADTISKLKVILDELLSNIMTHAYADEARHAIELRMQVEDHRVRLTITDDGKAFNPLETPPPAADPSIQQREEGGLGIQIVKALADETDYRREAEKNVLTVVKDFSL